MRPSKHITAGTYALLLEAFREKPGSVEHARQHAGVGWHKASRAWETGWPDRGFAPIQDVLAEEQHEAMLRLREAADERRSSAARVAREQAIDTQAWEMEAIAMAQAGAGEALRQSTALLRIGDQIADRLSEMVEDRLGDGDVSTSELLTMLRALNRHHEQVVKATRVVILADGAHRDKWYSGGAGAGGVAVPPSASPSEAVERIGAAFEAAQRFAKRKGLALVSKDGKLVFEGPEASAG